MVSTFVCTCVYVCAHMQESVNDMGLYEDVSGAGGASAQVTATPSIDLLLQQTLFKKTCS